MVEESKAKDFETYLISALNDSLLKKSKSSHPQSLWWFTSLFILCNANSTASAWVRVFRGHNKHSFWVLVDWGPREEYDNGDLPPGWQSAWDHHQGHQVFCQGNLRMRETQECHHHCKWHSLSYALVLVLGPLCGGQDWHLRKVDWAEVVRPEDSRVEQVLWLIPQRDEEHFYWGA